MLGEHSGCLYLVGGIRQRLSEHGFYLPARKSARSKQPHRLTGEAGDDRGFHADWCSSAVKDERDAAVQIGPHMLRRCRADTAGAVR